MTDRAHKRNPENLLFRSRTEICRILQGLAKENCPVSAEVKDGRTFASHLLSAAPETDRLTVAYSSSKLINTLVLDSPALKFTATTSKDVHFSFEAASPEESVFEGQPAIQFALPRTVLLHNRRENARLPVPADVSLRCIADEKGVIPFESRITDISRDGLGFLIYDPDVHLEGGAMLHGCRIILPSGEAVVADLQVRHATTIVLPNGSLARQAGFRFHQETDEAATILNHFMQDLDVK